MRKIVMLMLASSHSASTVCRTCARTSSPTYDIEQQIVYSSPTGTNVRLKDIANVKREYPDMESKISNNGKKCLLLSVEMKKGQNIVKMGEGKSRWHASIDSTTHFFKSIFSATLAISITFFPFLLVCVGMTKDFLMAFPFAVTIVLGTSLDKTSEVADSLEHILHKDKRIVSITSFKGCSSPRFHTAYAPQIAGTNYAQFIVTSKAATSTWNPSPNMR